MAFNVSDMRAQLVRGGARPNLFEVSLPFPAVATGGGIASQKMTFQCKAAQLPGADIGTVEVPYFGRVIKLAGNRTFAEWSTTILNDEDFAVHNAISAWMNAMNNHRGNKRTAAAAFPPGYQVNADVTHFGKAGDIIKRVTFVNLWPSSLAAIDLAWDSNDTLEEYTCTWQYDYWEISGVTS